MRMGIGALDEIRCKLHFANRSRVIVRERQDVGVCLGACPVLYLIRNDALSLSWLRHKRSSSILNRCKDRTMIANPSATTLQREGIGSHVTEGDGLLRLSTGKTIHLHLQPSRLRPAYLGFSLSVVLADPSLHLYPFGHVDVTEGQGPRRMGWQKTWGLSLALIGVPLGQFHRSCLGCSLAFASLLHGALILILVVINCLDCWGRAHTAVPCAFGLTA